MQEKKPPKKSLKILNTREKKEINQKLMEQWGCELDKSFAFLLSTKERLYIIDKDVEKIDLDKLRIDNLGLYVCNISDKGVRLTIEGSQMLGPKAKKNIVEFSENEVKQWFKGNDIEKTTTETGYVIIKNKDDFLGCGRATGNKIMNFVPKTRRILSD
jgi:NOL1/NOP2/fmu family ribosome biogenesis protein